MILRPFFHYYGAKWRAVHSGRYPEPQHNHIVEPFAGAAGYALHYPLRRVTLCDRDPVIAGIWRWLISATPDEVMSIPLTDNVDELPEWVPLGAKDLVGFSMNAATTSPRKTLSAGGLRLREMGRRFYGWTAEWRWRVAQQVPHIKHWQVNQADYTCLNQYPMAPATWFVDPPYVDAGKHYKFGPDGISYTRLAEWCKALPGQVIACEQSGASWLPFKDIGSIKSGPRTKTSAEAVWIKEAA